VEVGLRWTLLSAADNSSMETPPVDGQPPETGDNELLRRSLAGDGGAFHALADRHAERLYRLAVSMTGNRVDAEDIVQESLVGAFKGMKGFAGRSSVKTWLTRILVTQVARWRREQKRHRLLRPLHLAGLAAGHEAEDEKAEPVAGRTTGEQTGARLDLMEAIGRLSAEHKDVVVLRELEQLSYEEIAAVLGVPRGTVESRLHRARGELRERLKAYRL
jgi:RNA polymerase sigma-70 factor (ECF subfamily)